MRAVIHNEAAPEGTAYVEWINISGEWLSLDVPGLAPLSLCPGGRVQIPCGDLVKVPELEAWFEGLELRGVLSSG